MWRPLIAAGAWPAGSAYIATMLKNPLVLSLALAAVVLAFAIYMIVF